MKTFACVLLVAAVAAAEPAWFRQNFRVERQEVEPEPTTARTEDAPYPAAGYRPEIEFKLPQQGIPSTTYGIPDTSYGPPALEYGPPEVPTTETPVESTTVSLQVEGLTKEKIQEAPKQDAEVISNQGAYYVLLPGSQLQRVQFQTENDLRNMAYTARLQYKDEDRAPLYVYTTVPQYQTSASVVQVSGSLVQPATTYQPAVTYQPPATYQPAVTYQPSATYLPSSADYITPAAAYVQSW